MDLDATALEVVPLRKLALQLSRAKLPPLADAAVSGQATASQWAVEVQQAAKALKARCDTIAALVASKPGAAAAGAAAAATATAAAPAAAVAAVASGSESGGKSGSPKLHWTIFTILKT